MKCAVLVLLAVVWLTLGEAQPLHAATPFTARDQTAHELRTSWSPDGTWIAYGMRNVNGVYLASPDDLKPPLTFAGMGNGTWSPHGERLVMMASGSTFGRYVGDPITGLTTALESPIYIWGRVDFSPDEARLAYVRYTPSGARQLVVSAWNGTGPQVIAGDSWDPEWSPTGEEIAFAHDSACLAPGAIEVVRSDGTSRRSFASSGEWRVEPRWSPNGSLIAFLGMTSCAIPTPPAHVYVIRPDGTGERILGDVANHSIISWSPNGRWVAAMDRETDLSLTLLGTMGQAPVRFDTSSPTTSWAPDGEHVAYMRDGVIYIGATDGSERRLAPGFGADWSPDGSRLSYLAPAYLTEMPFDHCQTQAFVIGSDGQGGRALSPCWQEGDDGKNILVGTSGDDFAEAFGGSDRLYGGAGKDFLVGGGGSDRLYGGAGKDDLVGGPGADRIGARDGARDVVRCGPGRDVVYADRLDAISRDCEIVRRATT